jgi:nitrogen fixation protein FixH
MQKSGWIPYAFVAGFGVVLAANGALVYAATRQPVAQIVAKPYERGLAYNALLAEQEKQKALGWTVALSTRRYAGETAWLEIETRDPAGPLVPNRMTVTLVRPLEGDRHTADLVPMAGGRMQAVIPGLRPGQWQVEVRVERGTDHLNYNQRIILK